jgi:hypothetical protein
MCFLDAGANNAPGKKNLPILYDENMKAKTEN